MATEKNILSKKQDMILELRKRVKKIEALAGFYDEIQSRSADRTKDGKDIEQKSDYAKKKIIELCSESRTLMRGK